MGIKNSATLFPSQISNVVKFENWLFNFASLKSLKNLDLSYFGSLVIAFVVFCIEFIADVSPIEFNHVITDFSC